MERTPVRALKASVSCESIEVPEYQPLIERRPLSRNIGSICIDGTAPIASKVPLMANPPCNELIASAFVLSWLGHYLLERNTPAFFDAAADPGATAGLVKKVQVALGGVVWSGACFLRLFGLGPLAHG